MAMTTRERLIEYLTRYWYTHPAANPNKAWIERHADEILGVIG